MFEQAVDRGDGGEGLARAGGHLDEGAGAGEAEGFFEIGDGLDLARAKVGGIEGGEIVEAGAERAGGGEGFAEGLGAVEGKDLAGAGLGVALVGEADDDAGGLVEEGQGDAGGLDPLQLGGGVVGGLLLDGGDVGAEGFLFGFDDADGAAVDEKDVVGGAGVGSLFADGLAGAGVEVDGVLGLHGPTGGAELRVDGVAGDLLGVLVGRHRGGSGFYSLARVSKRTAQGGSSGSGRVSGVVPGVFCLCRVGPRAFWLAGSCPPVSFISSAPVPATSVSSLSARASSSRRRTCSSTTTSFTPRP